MPRRLLILITFLLLTLSASVYAARRTARLIYTHRSYNCLVMGDVSVQLNTHLEWDAPRILTKLDSPDGKTSLQVWGTEESQIIRLVDISTGQVIPLQRMRQGGNFYLPNWKWSPDSRYVYYSWWDDNHWWMAISSSDGTRSSTFKTDDSWTNVLDFSPDSDYLAFLQQYTDPPLQNLLFVAVDDFHTRKLTLSTRRSTYLDGFSWAPTGHRLAYYDPVQLSIANPETGMLGQFTYHVYTPDGYEVNSIQLQWSADQQYILYKYSELHPQATVLAVVAVRGVIPTPVARKVFRNLELRNAVYHWSPTGHSLVYLKLRTPSPEDDLLPTWPLGDLWRYDPDTGLDTRVAWDILDGFPHPQGAILVRRKPGGGLVELRDWDGSTPLITQTFDASNQEIRQRNFCDEPEYCWADEMFNLYYALPACPIRGFAPDQVEIRSDGQIVWNFKVPLGATVFSEPVRLFSTNTLYAAQCRFTARILQQGDHRWVEIGDLFTGTFYPLPETLASTLPPNFFDDPSPYRWWAFWIIPSPDDQTWMVYFQVSDYQGVVYFFRPADQRWTLLYQDTDYIDPSIDKVTWSPDSQRMAYIRWIPGNPVPTLFVTTADGSRQWNLGYFPYPWYGGLAWDKCGGIEAVLRGN